MFKRPLQQLLRKITISKSLSDQSITILHDILEHILVHIIRKCSPPTITSIHDTYSSLFSGELLRNMCSEGMHFQSAEHLSNLTVTPAMLRTYVEGKFPSIPFSEDCVWFLCGSMQYLMYELLDLSYIQCMKAKSDRIQYIHVYRAILYDTELSRMRRQFQIVLIDPKQNHLQFIETQKLLRSLNIDAPRKHAMLIHHYLERYAYQLLKTTHDLCQHFGKERIERTDIEYVYRHFQPFLFNFSS